MDLRSFADVLASRQGGIYLKPGKPYRRVLKRQEVIEIFGGVPEYSVRYGLAILINKLDDDNYEVLVTRTKA
jgi:hypothetical protein